MTMVDGGEHSLWHYLSRNIRAKFKICTGSGSITLMNKLAMRLQTPII
jgi:hypothetical protein